MPKSSKHHSKESSAKEVLKPAKSEKSAKKSEKDSAKSKAEKGRAKVAEKEKAVESVRVVKPIAREIVKPAVVASRTRTAAAKKSAEAANFVSQEEIERRAYFIAERRQRMGWPGDSTSDWVEAERQLHQEAVQAAKLGAKR